MTTSLSPCRLALLLTALTLPIGAIAVESVSPVRLEVLERVGAIDLAVQLDGLQVEQVVQDGSTFDLATIEGEPTIGIPGYPDLPVVSRTLLVPPDAGLRLIIEEVGSSVRAFSPVIAPRELPGGGFETIPAALDYRQIDGYWPPEPVELSEPAILRGHRLVSLRFYPLQVNPRTGETRINDRIRISVRFDGEPVNPVIDPRPKPSRSVQQMLDGIVLNPPPPRRDDYLGGSYLYVIPQVNGIDAEIAPLLEWRRRQGHRVAVAAVQNNTAMNVVMTAIRDAYQSDDPVEFVCLVGEATAGSALIVPASNQTGDYLYTLQEGNDPLPDISIGRLSATTLAQLRTIVGKIIPYESNPNMQDTDWYRQGAVVAGHINNGLSEVLSAKYVRKEMLGQGFTTVRAWLWPVDGEIGQNQPFVSNAFEWGVSCFFYRAFNRMNELPMNVIYDLRNRAGKYPAVIVISCNTGTFVAAESYTEAFLRAQGGGIGAVGTATGATNVRFNNLVAAGTWKGIYLNQLWCMGWGLNYGKFEIWRTYAGLDQEYLNFMDWNNLMGDPGTTIWSAVPRVVDVVHPNTFALGGSSFSVRVTDRVSGRPEPDAQVALYKDQQALFQQVQSTDADGRAWFHIPSGSLSAGSLLLTVTKHNVKPLLASIEVSAQNVYVGVVSHTLDDDAEGASNGDDDGVPNPGETLELTLQLRNFGNQQPNGEAILTARSLTPWAEVRGDPVRIEQLPAGGQSVETTIILALAPSIPDGEEVRIAVTTAVGETQWSSMLQLEAVGPRLTVHDLRFEGDRFLPGEIKTLDLRLRNDGRRPTEPIHARLLSDSNEIMVLDSEGYYQPFITRQPHGLFDSIFRLRAHPMTPPGSVANLRLLLSADNGFRDTLQTTVTLGQPGDTDPIGPDSYGYLCFDSGDQGWDQTPTFSWIEINPNIQNRNFNGSVLNLSDVGDNDDKSVLVNLPFQFTYYGRQYDRITVCTNGWAAFGDEREFQDFRNQHIGQALGPRAMLPVWWDNLITVQGAAICTYNDANGGRFIIEWSGMRRLLDGGGAGARETFEIILFNPARHPTETGDGIILYQYLEATNENARAHNDIPFCTIGIQNPDGGYGLEYTYWNTYPRGARPIASRMALKFTTSRAYRMGVVTGLITDAESGEPVPGAEIVSSGNYLGRSSEDGRYFIDDIQVGNNYSLRARATGWSDSLITGIEVTEGDTVEVDFQLLHPTFDIRPNEVGITLHSGEARQVNLTLENNGNGSLVWNVERRLPGNAGLETWDPRLSLNVGIALRDDRIEGVAFVNDSFFVCGAAGNNPNTIYVLDRDGRLERQFEQHGNSTYGYKDLAWDGELIWGSGERRVFGFTTEGELVRAFDGPTNPITALVWDAEHQLLWVAGITSNIFGVDRDGNLVRSIARGDLRIFGLAHWPEDPARRPIYVFCREINTDRQTVYRVDADERRMEFLTYLDTPQGGTTAGAEISNTWDIYNWTFVAICNNIPGQGGDRIDIYQLAQRRDWMQIAPTSGSLDAGANTALTLTLNADGLPEVLFEGELHFKHNASGGRTVVPVDLTVRAGGDFDARNLQLSSGWNLVSLNVAPPDASIEVITRPLVEAGSLVRVKDGRGRFYLPSEGFNNIPGWVVTEGYQFYLSSQAVLSVNGEPIEPNRPIDLAEGWNMVAYLPRASVPVEIAVSDIAEQLLCVKDGRGRFYLPEWDYSNMDHLREGAGYQMKAAEATRLVYNTAGRARPNVQPAREPLHFAKHNEQGEGSMSLLLLADVATAGREAGVVNENGEVVAGGVFDSDGRAGLAIFGNDPYADDIEGPREGDPLRIVLWNGEQEVEPLFEILSGQMLWIRDGITVLHITQIAAQPAAFSLTSLFPNPFNSSVRISFGLDQAGQVELTAYDLTGRRMASIFAGNSPAGSRSLVWEAGNLPSGIYLISLTSGNRRVAAKVVLAR
ncbi:MAG: T9SS type A sorting domain-containing protein [Calditrichaeota bacterium]|nr:T9SS type A sorting domain-containing protein [Calditrichota bacterium]